MNFEVLIALVLFAVIGIWAVAYKKISKSDKEKSDKEKSQEYWNGIGMSIGMLVGYAVAFVVFWLVESNIAIAVAIGPALGVGLGTGLGAHLKKKNANNPISEEKYTKFRKKMMISVLAGILTLALGLYVFAKTNT